MDIRMLTCTTVELTCAAIVVALMTLLDGDSTIPTLASISAIAATAAVAGAVHAIRKTPLKNEKLF